MNFEQSNNNEMQDRSAEDIKKEIEESRKKIKDIVSWGDVVSGDRDIIKTEEDKIKKLEEELNSLEGGEKRMIKMTKDQFYVLHSGKTDDPEVIKLMDTLGLEMNSGLAEIEIDGEKKTMNTSENDFGTILSSKEA